MFKDFISHFTSLSTKQELGETLKIDLHSHIIPNIDDGVDNLEESIEMLEKFVSLGYSKIITTPHMMQDRYENSHEKINDGLLLVRKELAKRSIKIEIDAAAEYYLDEQFQELLYRRELLTFSSNYILFEISPIYQPTNLFDLVLEMKIAGYIPVMAHPERYYCMHNNYEVYKSLKDKGVLFQIDLLSLTTYQTTAIQKVVLWLSSQGMIDFVGTDAHRMKHLDIIEKLKSTTIFKEICNNNNLLNKIL